MFLRTGTLVDGRYRVSQPLGGDARHERAVASHLHLARTVTIKLLVDEDARNKKRFFREGRLLSMVRHRNIIDVHDMGTHEERPYLALEYMEGPTLAEHLSKGERLSLREVGRIGEQLIDAIAHSHSRRIIHRGLGLEKVHLIEDARVVKVCGFGSGRSMDVDTTSIAGTETLLEDSMHFAPEQVLAEGKPDERTDVYALGVAFYRLLAGKHPFHARNIVDLIGKILGEPPTPPSAHRSSLSPAVDATILRALAKRPDQRQASAQTFWEELAPGLGFALEPRTHTSREPHS